MLDVVCSAGFALHSSGGGGLPELHGQLLRCEAQVLFGYARVVLGRGQFRRQKLVYVHWAGHATNPIRRFRHNSRSSEARGQRLYCCLLHPPSHCIAGVSTVTESASGD